MSLDKNKFVLYADIKSQIKDLQEQESKLKTEIEQAMDEAEIDEVKTDFGNFSYIEKTNYEYSDKVKQLDVKLKQEKKKEEKSGEATPTKKRYLRFTFNNAKDN
jgi:5'-deoxynucleotidase YfbR-like HD superfamily hydrolase